HQRVARIAYQQDLAAVAKHRMVCEPNWKVAKTAIHIARNDEVTERRIIDPLGDGDVVVEHRLWDLEGVIFVVSSQIQAYVIQQGAAAFAKRQNEQSGTAPPPHNLELDPAQDAHFGF